MARIAASVKAERDARIALLLDNGWPLSDIAADVGVHLATVYRVRNARMDTAVADSPVAAMEVEESREPTPTYGDCRQPAMVELYAVGVMPETLAAAFDVDLDAVVTEDARLAAAVKEGEVMEGLAERHPAKWAELMRRRREAEQAAAKSDAIPKADFEAFFGDVARHQATLLGEAAMGEWLRWVKELTQNRYPKFA